MLPDTTYTTRSYDEIQVIGKGAEGTVYKARDSENPKKFYALKKLVVPINNKGLSCNLIREIAYLRYLRNFDHANIVKILDVGTGAKKEEGITIFIVFEHIEHDLHKYLTLFPSTGLPLPQIRSLMQQLLEGVHFLHSHRIIHRDIKPQNILVTSEGKLKLTDFGLARDYNYNMNLTSVVVTLWYRPPEVLLNSPYSFSVDLWSCGCIFAELYTRKPLFCGSSEIDQLRKIIEKLGYPNKEDFTDGQNFEYFNYFRIYTKTSLESLLPEMSLAAIDLLKKLLLYNPLSRINAESALKHLYFSSLCE